MRARRIAWAAVVLSLVRSTAGLAQDRPAQCSDPVGDLGIEEILCSSGGHCMMGFTFEDGYVFRTFTTEPRVHRLKPPADAVLEVGDVIVSVDGNLSTTADAIRRLRLVEPGNRVRLKIRRDGVEKVVTITAIASCDRRHRLFAFDDAARRHWDAGIEAYREAFENFNWPGLAPPLGRFLGFDWEDLGDTLVIPPMDFRFEIDSLHVRPFARVTPPYELGVELTCGFFCGWRRGEGDTVAWRGQHPPKVARVVEGGPADRAGIEEGDVLLLLDGHSFVGEEGGRALGRLGPGRPLTLQYLKGGETLTTTTITPREPTAR